MKKILLIIALVALGAQAVGAQRRDVRPRTSYNNFSYVMEQRMVMEQPISGTDDALLGEADWGAAFTKGRTYNLHRPIANMLVFGIDATWLDLNYAQYEYHATDGKLHQADVSVGVGPSINLYPVSKLGIHGYIRYNPTFATYFDDEFTHFMGGYSSVLVSGGGISFGPISVGAEARWGTGKYKDLVSGSKQRALDDIVERIPEGAPKDMIDDALEGVIRPTSKIKTSGVRVYLSLRF